MLPRILSQLLLLFCLISFKPAGAQTQVSTFGTLAYASTDSSSATYRLAPNYQFAADKHWTSVLDSRVGIHGRVDINETVSMVGQLLLRRNRIDNADWSTPWAYLNWQPTTQYEFMMGRFRHSLFMITDEMDIGYAWPWVRPPVELYSLVGESNFVDGVKLRYRDTIGNYTAVIESHFAQLTLDRRPSLHIKNHKNYGVALSLSNEVVTYRASLVQAQVTVQSARLDALIAQIATQSPSIADEYRLSDISPQRYLNLGMRYEDGDWLLLTEVSRLWLNTLAFPNKWAYYLTAGRTFDNLTPYLSFARQNMAGFQAESRLSGSVGDNIRQFQRTAITEQSTLGAGIRWDVAAGMAIKVQFDQVRQPQGSAGTSGQLLPAGQDKYLLSTVSIDWVY